MTIAFRPVTAVLVGATAGLTAAFAMNRFQAAWSAASPGASDAGSAERKPPATERAADDLVWLASGRRLDSAARKRAGSAVHYGFGAILGVVYRLLRDRASRFSPGRGAAFGIAAALVIDEGAVPLLGWSDAPDRAPWSVHAYGLISHIVFGVVLEAARRVLDLATGGSGLRGRKRGTWRPGQDARAATTSRRRRFRTIARQNSSDAAAGTATVA